MVLGGVGGGAVKEGARGGMVAPAPALLSAALLPLLPGRQQARVLGHCDVPYDVLERLLRGGVLHVLLLHEAVRGAAHGLLGLEVVVVLDAAEVVEGVPLLAQRGLQGRGLREGVLRLRVVHHGPGAAPSRAPAPVHLCGPLVVNLERLQLQELWQRLLVLLREAVDAVLAPSVGALELRGHRLADRAQDEVVRLVLRPVALGVQPLEARLAEAVRALRAVAGGHRAALYAIELPLRAGVEWVVILRLLDVLHQLLGDAVLRALVAHDLHAPLHLLRVELALMVHLRERLEEGLQRPDHIRLFYQVAHEDVPEVLHVLRRH
mmetsp:Transcript_80179/g.226995  ORF Transcript_80179/g.226995 Transcript_80179/m.226995 type:complete len:321 (+) Transcript_80179:102-1064(+)